MKKLFIIIVFLLNLLLVACSKTKISYNQITLNSKPYYNLKIDNIITNILLETPLSNKHLKLYKNYNKEEKLNLKDFFTNKSELKLNYKNYVVEEMLIYNRFETEKEYFYKQIPFLHLVSVIKCYSKEANKMVPKFLYDHFLRKEISLEYINFVIINTSKEISSVNSYFLEQENKEKRFFINGLPTEYIVNKEKNITEEKIEKIFSNVKIKGLPFFYDFDKLKYLEDEHEDDELGALYKNDKLEKRKNLINNLQFKSSYIKKVGEEYHIINIYYYTGGVNNNNYVEIDTYLNLIDINEFK